MPISEAEAFGPTLSAKRKKAEETGFIESALAGVITGVINIPKGFISLGAELMDATGMSQNAAARVEAIFDKINPFEEIANQRATGKILEALERSSFKHLKRQEQAKGFREKFLRQKTHLFSKL